MITQIGDKQNTRNSCHLCHGTQDKHKLDCKLHYLSVKNHPEPNYLHMKSKQGNMQQQNNKSIQINGQQLSFEKAQSLLADQNQKTDDFRLSCVQSMQNYSLCKSQNNEKAKFNQNKQNKQVFNSKQIQFLKSYFKYLCQKHFMINKMQKKTFDDVKICMQSMNLTEWMLFCKQFRILQYQQKLKCKKITQQLKNIFTKFQNKQKRLNFEKFCQALKYLIIHIVNGQNTKQQSQQAHLLTIKEYLCLSSQEQYKQKLRRIGVLPYQQTNQNTLSNITKLSQTKNIQNNKKSQKQNNETHLNKKPIKLYLFREDRIRSRILKNLDFNNLNKYTAPNQMRKNFQLNYKQNDIFLQQYIKNKQQIAQGILNKLQRKQHVISTKKAHQHHKFTH